MKISFFSAREYDEKSFNAVDSKFELTFHAESLNANTYHLARGANAICAFVNDELDAAVLQRLSKIGIQCILLRSAGFNNVDLNAAKSNKISVYRVPAYSPNSVAEHAVALMMTLNRQTNIAHNKVQKHDFSLDGLQGFDIFKKTVGVIGTGKIGEAFCNILLGFGARVIAFDISPNDNLKTKGVEYVELNEIWQQSDIISLHCPLNTNTKYLIDKGSLSLMKDGVMIINTSRGPIVNTKDVIDALNINKIGYLGLDVYEHEKEMFFHDLSEIEIKDELFKQLKTFPNVLITGHQGFFTNEALNEIAQTSLNNLNSFLNKTETENQLV